MVAPTGVVGAATVARGERAGSRRSQPGGRGRAGRSRRVPRGNGRAPRAATFVRLDGGRRKWVALGFGPARGTTGAFARKFACVTGPSPARARENFWSGGVGCHRDRINRLGWSSGIHQRRVHEDNEANLEPFAGRVRASDDAGNRGTGHAGRECRSASRSEQPNASTGNIDDGCGETDSPGSHKQTRDRGTRAIAGSLLSSDDGTVWNQA